MIAPFLALILPHLVVLPPQAARGAAGDTVGTCRQCVVELTEELRIGGSDDPFGLSSGDASRLAVTEWGGVWVSPMLVPHGLAMYGPGGDVDVFVDKEGKGPGEYEFILGIRYDEGMLHVMSPGRLSRHDADTGVFSGSSPIRIHNLGFLPLAEQWTVVNGSSYSGERAGFTLHLIDPRGEVHRSFGHVSQGVEFDPPGTTLVLGPGRNGVFWAARVNQYRIDKWSPEGEHLLRIQRDVSWFRPWRTWVSPRDGDPPPRIAGVWEDDANQLWVLHVVGDEAHDPQRYLHVRSNEIQGPTDDAYDTVIEVLDAETGELISSRRFPSRLVGFVDGRVIAFDLADDGGQQLVILRPELVRR